jgi:glycosyltransferase involved in cell wall biosynthesis
MSKVRPNESPKILLVAEHASATFGGEALIPLQYFQRLREMDVDVHLLVHERTKKELRGAFPDDLERLHFVTDSFVNIWCDKIGKLMPDRLAVFTVGAASHLETQIRQRRLARSLVGTHRFDIIHEPIPVSPKLPSILFGLSAPLIIGPMNGGMDYPPNYNLAGRLERFIILSLRSTAGFWNSILPGKRQAALLLVANKRTYNALPAKLRKKRIFEFVENGVDVDLFRPESTSVKHGSFRIIYVGRLIDWKRVDLLIDACKRLSGSATFELDIVGDGPKRVALEEQVRRLSLAGHVRFHGRLPQTAAAGLLRSADVMVLPSMRECGGAVVLEAMASGVPVIAADWGGPADYITADTGILIAPATPDMFVDELAKAILSMARNPQAQAKIGQAGRRRAEALYDWRAKTRALMKIYEDVLSTRRPETSAECILISTSSPSSRVG